MDVITGQEAGYTLPNTGIFCRGENFLETLLTVCAVDPVGQPSDEDIRPLHSTPSLMSDMFST